MKIRMGEILLINNVLKSIIDNSDLKIEPLFKFKLLGIIKTLETPVNNFEIIRNEKIAEYGKEFEDGKIGIEPTDIDAINKINECLIPLLDNKIDIDIKKIKAEDIFKYPLLSNDLTVLYPIIEE